MILYFIRHGKTKLNFEKRISGARVDAPLSSSGILELRDYVKEKLYPADPGNCYASNMKRTQQTLHVIYPDRDCKYTALLQERDFGAIETEKDREKIIRWRKSIFDEQGKEREEAFGSGECTRIFAERVNRDFQKFLDARFENEEKKITVCGHGAYLRQLGFNYGIMQLDDYRNLVCNGKGVVFDIKQMHPGKYSMKIIDFIGGGYMREVMEIRKFLE